MDLSKPVPVSYDQRWVSSRITAKVNFICLFFIFTFWVLKFVLVSTLMALVDFHNWLDISSFFNWLSPVFSIVQLCFLNSPVLSIDYLSFLSKLFQVFSNYYLKFSQLIISSFLKWLSQVFSNDYLKFSHSSEYLSFLNWLSQVFSIGYLRFLNLPGKLETH